MRTPEKPKPVLVSQATSLDVLGMKPDRFLSFLRTHRQLPRVRDGKLVLVRVADFEALFEELSKRGTAEGDDEDLDTPEGVLARVRAS